MGYKTVTFWDNEVACDVTRHNLSDQSWTMMALVTPGFVTECCLLSSSNSQGDKADQPHFLTPVRRKTTACPQCACLCARTSLITPKVITQLTEKGDNHYWGSTCMDKACFREIPQPETHCGSVLLVSFSESPPSFGAERDYCLLKVPS